MRLLFALSLAFAATAAVAADGDGAEEKPAAVPASEGDAIAGAKRDFEAMKASRAGMAQPKDATPRVSLPGLHTAPAEPAPWAPAGTVAPEAKPDNWLVDAMEKGADVRRPRSRADRDHAQRGSEGKLRPDNRPDGGERPAFAEINLRENDPTLNPLTRFLSGWMTPRDYVLLQPALGGIPAAPASGYSEVNPLPLSGGRPSQTELGESDFRLKGRDTFHAGRLPQPVNPYLPQPPPSGGRPTALSPPVSLPAVAGSGTAISSPPPAPVPANTSKIPEFARPAADEKYFKQLKRF